jgi:DNA-binding NarL/FixJ family response regulator
MHPPVILLCARHPVREVWLRALDTTATPSSVVALSEEAALLDFAGRDDVAAVIADRESCPSVRDPMLRKLRDSFAGAKLVLAVRTLSPKTFDACRALRIDACVPHHYNDLPRQLALDLALAGAGTYPGDTTESDARPTAHAATPPLGNSGALHAFDDDYDLTTREKDVAVGVARGRTNHEIALDLGLAPGVVRNHVTSVLEKLDVSNRTQAATILLRLPWVRALIEDDAREGRGVLDRMLAHVEHVTFREGTVIFRKGEPGQHMYYIQRGVVGLDEIDVEMGPGEIFGDIGAFAPQHLRTCTARARTDVDLFRLSGEHVRRVFFESPEFAFYVVSVIAERVAQERGL